MCPSLSSSWLTAVALVAALVSACDRGAGVSGLAVPSVPVGPLRAETDVGVSIAFYNVENLFDPRDDLDNDGDDEFLPEATKRWTTARYGAKLSLLARVIDSMGAVSGAGAPALVGLAEVENAGVLADLTAALEAGGLDYDYVHFDSPDYRGIDNALLYRPGAFAPLAQRAVEVSLPPREGRTRRRTTRDILYVKGLLRGDTIHYLVNHWPSRGGGEEASRPGRFYVAEVVRGLVDSIRGVNPAADVIIGGDLNDDPEDASVVRVLGAAGRRDLVTGGLLYNPFVALQRRGEGSLGYRREWNLFDQLLFSEGLARHGGDWSVRNVQVFAPAYLLQDAGAYAGFPARTYVGDDYRGGASDHLPVYAVLQRP